MQGWLPLPCYELGSESERHDRSAEISLLIKHHSPKKNNRLRSELDDNAQG